MGEYSLALQDFQAAAAASAPASEPHRAALYGEASTWFLCRPGQDEEKAAALFRQVIDLAPGDSLAAWSLLALARIKAQPVDGEAPDAPALDAAYQAVIDRFPAHPAGEEAFLYQQAARMEMADEATTRAVLAALETFLEAHPGSPWRSAANNLIVHACTVLGLPGRKLEAAIACWKTAEIDPNDPFLDLAYTYWRIATVAEFDAGDFATAREYFGKLIEEYPTDQKVFIAKQELKRMEALEARLKAGEDAP